MTALPSKHFIGCRVATEEEDDPETSGEESWRMRCGQQDTRRVLEEDGGGSTEQSSRWRRMVRGLCSISSDKP